MRQKKKKEEEEAVEEEEEEEEEYRTHSTRWCTSSFPRWCWWQEREGGRAWYPSVQLSTPGWSGRLDGSSTWPARSLLSPHQLAAQPPPRCHKHKQCTATGDNHHLPAQPNTFIQLFQISAHTCARMAEREEGVNCRL